MSIQINCPHCGQPLIHELTEGRWHFYDCRQCGPYTLPPSGSLRRLEPEDISDAGLKDEEAGAPLLH